MTLSLVNSSTTVSGTDLLEKFPAFFSALVKTNAGLGSSDLTYIHLVNYQWQMSKEPVAYKWAQKIVDFLSKSEHRPWILINGHSDAMKHLRFQPEGTGEAIHKTQLAVYLYEPIQFSREANQCTTWYPADQESADYFSAELTSLVEFCRKHPDLDVTTYVCDEGLTEHIRRHPEFRGLRVKTMDIFLVDHALTNAFPGVKPPRSEFAKRAICLNYRYDYHREIVAAYLRGKDYHQDTYLSFFHQHEPDAFERGLPFAFDDWGESATVRLGLSKMQNELPVVVDTANSRAFPGLPGQVPNLDGDVNVRNFELIRRKYAETFVVIANESRYFSYFPNVSEKTLDAAIEQRPFIVVGAPGCLRYLRDLGFKTFHDFWDESYDDELDHKTRFARIFRLIDRIFAMTPAELGEMSVAMHSVLAHNRLHIKHTFARDRSKFIGSELVGRKN
jgi:hypothetical protein